MKGVIGRDSKAGGWDGPEGLLETLRDFHPDLSDFTVVSLSNRSRDFLRHLLHRRLGGLLPDVLSFDEYLGRRIKGIANLAEAGEQEALVRFHALRRRRGHRCAPADSRRLLAFLSTLSEFSVREGELAGLERLSAERFAHLRGLFSLREEFRSSLAKEGLFYLPLEAERWACLSPGERDLFVGIPLLTPANEAFFGRIKRDRLFAVPPLFGPHMPAQRPPYDSALSLVRRLGLGEVRGSRGRLEFSELADRPSLKALLAAEIESFLKGLTGGQLFVVLLDERLSFYLWELLFKPLGLAVNFSLWVPFTHFAAGRRLLEGLAAGRQQGALRRELIAELAGRWGGLDEDDRAAFEAAISLLDDLERLEPFMGDDRQDLVEYLAASKKLRLPGRREAPVQVVGMGEATGIPYERAVLLPLGSGVFPRPPLRGPYVNEIHLPRLHRARYEADDLELRQLLSYGGSAHLVALYDEARGEAPSPLFAFLATEFGLRPVPRRLAAVPFDPPAGEPAVAVTAGLREALENYRWSFSTLGLFFTCPYRFVVQEIQRIRPPSPLEQEEGANLVIGSFLHRFFLRLKQERPAWQRWRALFDELWDADGELAEKLPDRRVRKALVRSYLEDIARWEEGEERRLVFSDEVIEAELPLQGTLAGRFSLTGRIDRLQRRGEGLLVVDFKYKERPDYSRHALAELALAENSFDDRLQLVIYVHLLLENKMASLRGLAASHVFLRPRRQSDVEAVLPEEELSRCGETMAIIASRLEGLLKRDRLLPNYRCVGCDYCAYKALCLRPDLYRRGGRSW